MGGVQSGSAGHVFENLIILGSAPGEGYGSPPGDLRAYDVLTGKLVWTFHTIPRPGEFGYDTWPPDAWKYAGGANAWGEISIDDEARHRLLPAWLADVRSVRRRSPRERTCSAIRCSRSICARANGSGTTSSCITICGTTIRSRAPKLLTVKHDGKNVDIVAQATKFGLLYVFDRVTGQPLWPIEERAGSAERRAGRDSPRPRSRSPRSRRRSRG